MYKSKNVEINKEFCEISLKIIMLSTEFIANLCATITKAIKHG